MLDQLSPNDLRLVRKFFEEQGLPLTEENVQKYATGDVLKKIFAKYGADVGMTAPDAERKVDEIRASAGTEKAEPSYRATPEGIAEEPIPEDLSIPALEEDAFLANPPVGGTSKADEESTKDADTTPSYLREPSADTTAPSVEDWGKGTTNQFGVPGAVGDTDLAPAAADIGSMSKEDRKAAFGKDTKNVSDTTGETLTGDVEQPELAPGVYLAPFPRDIVPQGSTVPGSQEVMSNVVGEAATGPFEALRGFVAQQRAKLVADAQLKEGDPKKMTEDERNQLLVATEIIQQNLNSPDPWLDSIVSKAGEKVTQKRITDANQALFNKLDAEFQQLLDSVGDVQQANNEQIENLYDERFRVGARKPKVEKEYRAALSAIDRKRMLDQIVKGIGQFAAGAIGQWGFQRPVPVGAEFKYEARDFAPEQKEAGLAYREQLKNISDEMNEIQKMIAKGVQTPDINKRIEAVATYMRALVDRAKLTQTEAEASVGTTAKRGGAYDLAKREADLLDKERERQSKEKIAKERAKRPPMSVTVQNVKGATTGDEIKLSPAGQEMWRKLNTLGGQIGSLFQKADAASYKELAKMASYYGLSEYSLAEAIGPVEEWHKTFSSPAQFHKAILDAQSAEQRGLGVKSWREIRNQQTARNSPANIEEPPPVNPKPGIPAPLRTAAPTPTPGPISTAKPEPAETAKPTVGPQQPKQYKQGVQGVVQLPSGEKASLSIAGNTLIVIHAADRRVEKFPLNSPEAQKYLNASLIKKYGE